MPHAPSSSPVGTTPAGLAPCSPFDRDDARYWHARPADHGLNGLYADGPQPGVDPIVKLAGTVSASAITTREQAAQDAAESRALRQALPAPELARPSGYLALLDAMRGNRARRRRRAA